MQGVTAWHGSIVCQVHHATDSRNFDLLNTANSSFKFAWMIVNVKYPKFFVKVIDNIKNTSAKKDITIDECITHLEAHYAKNK